MSSGTEMFGKPSCTSQESESNVAKHEAMISFCSSEC